MVEVIDDWLYDLLDVTEIHYPAEVFVKGACDMDGEPVRVSVQAGALMAFGYVWQAVAASKLNSRKISMLSLTGFLGTCGFVGSVAIWDVRGSTPLRSRCLRPHCRCPSVADGSS